MPGSGDRKRHLRGGADNLKRRTEAAHKHLDDFGIAHFCGYGREVANRMDELLGDLSAGDDELQHAWLRASRWARRREASRPSDQSSMTMRFARSVGTGMSSSSFCHFA